jgi:hypothetical protein
VPRACWVSRWKRARRGWWWCDVVHSLTRSVSGVFSLDSVAADGILMRPPTGSITATARVFPFNGICTVGLIIWPRHLSARSLTIWAGERGRGAAGCRPCSPRHSSLLQRELRRELFDCQASIAL